MTISRRPTGTAPPAEIFDLTRRSVEDLFALGCPLVVLACNTAAATSLRRLQQEWLPRHYPERRILGVLVPMVEAITGVPWMTDLPPRQAGKRQTWRCSPPARRVLSNAYPLEIGKKGARGLGGPASLSAIGQSDRGGRPARRPRWSGPGAMSRI